MEYREHRSEGKVSLTVAWIRQRTDAVRDLEVRHSLHNVTALEDGVFVGLERCPRRVFDLGCLASISRRSFLVQWCGIIAAQLMKLLINRCQIARDHIARVFKVRIACYSEVATLVINFDCGFAVSDSRIQIEFLVRSQNLSQHEDMQASARRRHLHIHVVNGLNDIVGPRLDLAGLRVAATIQIDACKPVREHEAHALFGTDDRACHRCTVINPRVWVSGRCFRTVHLIRNFRRFAVDFFKTPTNPLALCLHHRWNVWQWV